MLPIKPLGFAERLLDALFIPIMYCLSGTFSEHPQMTHRWNNHHLKHDDIAHLRRGTMFRCRGRNNLAVTSHKGVLFHIPIFGGWKKYVVLEPIDSNVTCYHVGWVNSEVCGVSRIPITGKVRLLAGSKTVRIFAVSSDTGEQVRLKKVGQGTIGSGGTHCRIPLL